ncbi:ABC transporter permease [Streptomyces sp. SID13666]|uniref:ABC transporter permease n=1 Tax=unclassified Streptomyces TaxID=2593676 RepID=UPI0013C245B9|nr:MULTISPECIES: ABC transporter permease [unclassified Streptomyces]NEA58772.1 ABC transporter permease [Streptomyces sp. SID13666]NEA70087.1 ABC transporter permease [Streptomyces sp. SID13588]
MEAEHGAQGRARSLSEGWRAFKRSPFLPAVVLVFIVAAAAGLFAGSYCYAMANPTPHRIPTAVTGNSDKGEAFVAGMEKALGASLVVRRYATYDQAVGAIEDQKAFAIIELRPAEVRLDTSGAAGASVSRLLTAAAPKVGAVLGTPVTVRDIRPLQSTDPQGLALFYISLAAVIIGFVGAIQLSVHARALNAGERIAFTALYSALGGFVICAVVDWLLGVLDLPFAQSWLILALTMFTSGMVFTMFNTLVGRWAMIPTWGLMVLLGNPSSGGAVSWPLLPSPLGHIGRWLPPGASVNAQHNAIYFAGHQFVFPYLVLIAWSTVAVTVFTVWRNRHSGGREHNPLHATAPAAT